MKLRWIRQQAGLYVAFDGAGRSVGYVFNRGPGAWSASGPTGQVASGCESIGKAKAAVVRAIAAAAVAS